MAKNCWVGLDVGEAQTHICVLGDGDEPLLQCSTASSAHEIAICLTGYPPSEIGAVVLESGGPIELVRRLTRIGFPVAMLDARKAHRYLSIRHNKTDKNDARGLAEIARIGDLSKLSVHCRSESAQHLRNTLAVRNRLVLVNTAVRNSLRSMLRNNGSCIRSVSRGRPLGEAVRAELRLLRSTLPIDIDAQLLPLLETCEATAEAVRRLDFQVKALALGNPVTSRFMQIPGVGPICAVSFFATIDDPSRFRRTADVGAYLGMVPRVHQPGDSRWHTRITKAGHPLTRAYLFLSAGVMMSRAAKHCAIRDWGVELAARIGYKKARVAVARKIAVAMLGMWKFDRDFAPYP